MNVWAWVSFWILSFIWGSSFLLIRVGVEEMSATQVVFIRATIAMVGLNAVRYLRAKPFPRDFVTIRAIIFIGIGNAAIPYTFISLGEQVISSGMAAVLQATAALFTLVIAHFAFDDERMTNKKVIGLILGFSGVVVLSSTSFEAGGLDTATLLGQLAIVCASIFYAIFTVYSRKVLKGNIEPIVISAGMFISATVVAGIFVIVEPLLGGRAWVPLETIQRDNVYAVFGLGFFNTFIAYLFFYFIIQQLGAFRATMVTYVVPVVGLVLGWAILDETVDLVLLLGATMIFIGIAIINLRVWDIIKARGRLNALQPEVGD